MAKLSQFKTPTGVSGNIFSIADWGQLILGSAVLIIAFATGQKLVQKTAGKVPLMDSSIEKPWNDPVVVNTNKDVYI